MKDNSRQILIILSFLAIYLIWGTTYLAIAIGVRELPPFLMAFLRFSSAGIIMLAYVFFKGEKFPKLKTINNNLIVGSIILVGGQGLLIWSEQYIASGYASILIATLPFWFVVMDKRHWNLYFKNPKIIFGLILGFVGILFLFRDSLGISNDEVGGNLPIIASMVTLFGGVCWVAGTIYYRSHPSPGSMYSNLGWQLLLGSIVCLVISFSFQESAGVCWEEITVSAWGSVLYLSIAGSIVAFVAYTWLMKEVPSAMVSTYAYVNPIIAVFVGWLIADEIITSNQILGMVIILAGAFLVNINKAKAPQTKS